MPKKVLLIHDTRTVGVITATVLARVLPRVDPDKNLAVDALFGRALTAGTLEFWRNAKRLITDKFQADHFQKVILCCVGFDDRNVKACSETLEWLKSDFELEIYSHKWPDGYTRAGFESLVSPHAIAEKYGPYLKPVEWHLLRTSLIAARETDKDLVTHPEIDFANRLGKNIWPTSTNHKEQEELEKKRWDLLVGDLPRALEELQGPDASVREPTINHPEINPNYVVYWLEEESPVSIEKTLEAQSDLENFPNPGIAIGLVNWGQKSGSRVYLVRPWRQRKNLPSISDLLATYGEDHDLHAQEWIGTQDAKHLVLSPTQTGNQDLVNTLPGRLRRFCDAVSELRYGSRQPHPWAAQFIHNQATEILERVDLCKRFAKQENPELFFDPEGTQIILSRSNRSNSEHSRTLSLRLVVESPDAAAFLFAYGGYNFSKLEMSLDGALGAIAKIPSLWFGGTTVPSKLRIDPRIRSLDGIGDAFNKTREIATLSQSAAKSSNVIEHGSVIANALEENEHMIVFRGSETIGPSVQYASLAHLIVKTLHYKLDKKINVLELFSGSGFCSRRLLKPPEMARIVCVDAAVSAETVRLHDSVDIIWLRTLVEEVLDPDGVFYGSYDIVLMDPPHGIVLDVLFGGTGSSVVERASKLAPGLLIYIGHDTQSSRNKTVARALATWYRQVTIWMVGSEQLISAGGSKNCKQTWDYDTVMKDTFVLAQQREADRPWPFKRFDLSLQ